MRTSFFLLPAVLLAGPAAAQARWFRIDPVPALRGAAMTIDPLGRVLLFGGSSGGLTVYQQSWTWDGVRWTELRTAQAPPARAYAGITLDVGRRRVVLFGGTDMVRNLGDTWEWDGAAWTLALAGGTPASPFPSANPLLAYDAARRRTVLFESMVTYEWDGIAWTQMATANNPGQLYGASMTWHAASGRVVLFGGLGPPTGPDATWTYDGIDWRRETPVQSPPPRSWAGMTYDWWRGRAIVSSGRSQVGGTTPHGDAWEWDGSTWQPLATLQPLPPREGVQLVFDPSRARLVLFGGGSSPVDVQSDVWEHSGSTWARVYAGSVLPPAAFARAVFDVARGQTLLHAGDDSTWEHDGIQWRLVAQASGLGQRQGFALAHDRARNRTVLFGGTRGGFSSYLNDTWEWDGVAWTQLQPVVRPPVRSHAAMAYDERRARTVLFGGRMPSGPQADTWEWDGAAWQPIATTSAPVTGDWAMAYDARRQRMVLFAGQTTGGETWEWDGVVWTPHLGAGQPAARFGYALAYDALRDRTVMAGGNFNGGIFTDEVWEWDGTVWTRQATATPQPRINGALVFDAVRGNLLLSGGQFLPAWLRETWRCATDRPAAFVPFGTGCAGSAGVPVLATVAGLLPWLGDTIGVELQGLGNGAAAAIGFGEDASTWGGLPLPASLAPAMPGCTLYVDLATMTDLRAAGNTRWDFGIPIAPVLVGLRLYCQGLVLDAAVPNAFRACVSNAAAATLGVR